MTTGKLKVSLFMTKMINCNGMEIIIKCLREKNKKTFNAYETNGNHNIIISIKLFMNSE